MPVTLGIGKAQTGSVQTFYIGTDVKKSRGQEKHMALDPASVQALTFDVFGTVVDWRGSILREGERLNQAKGLQVDWGAFVDAWREGYRPSMDHVSRGEWPWTKLDVIHRRLLEELIPRYELERLSKEEREHLNRAWHRLDPWPDAVAGLTRLRRRYILATLSNGNVGLLTRMAKYAGLPWDVILSAELAQHYKPDREAYLTAAELLDLRPDQILMVAAHQYDLETAHGLGFRTAFIPRPTEYGPGHPADLTPEPAFDDLVATDLEDLASQLGT